MEGQLIHRINLYTGKYSNHWLIKPKHINPYGEVALHQMCKKNLIQRCQYSQELFNIIIENECGFHADFILNTWIGRSHKLVTFNFFVFLPAFKVMSPDVEGTKEPGAEFSWRVELNFVRSTMWIWYVMPVFKKSWKYHGTGTLNHLLWYTEIVKEGS